MPPPCFQQHILISAVSRAHSHAAKHGFEELGQLCNIHVWRQVPGLDPLGQSGHQQLMTVFSWTWRERMVVPAAGLFALPQADLHQLAMFGISPPTAALLLSAYVTLNPGNWIVQNAANSGVGRAVIAIAKARGLKSVNIALRADLQAAGDDVVLLDGDGVQQQAL